jgi:hypothetical protein
MLRRDLQYKCPSRTQLMGGVQMSNVKPMNVAEIVGGYDLGI